MIICDMHNDRNSARFLDRPLPFAAKLITLLFSYFVFCLVLNNFVMPLKYHTKLVAVLLLFLNHHLHNTQCSLQPVIKIN